MIIIIIVIGVGPRCSCKGLFKKLDILPVPCFYLLCLMTVVVSNLENFQTNSSLNYIHTRHKNHLHKPTAYLSCFQKEVTLV